MIIVNLSGSERTEGFNWMLGPERLGGPGLKAETRRPAEGQVWG
jgi:hypothetical protein